MENIIKIVDCVEFKNDLHKKLYKKSGVNNFDEYIKYIHLKYSDNKSSSEKAKARPPSLADG